MYSAHNHVMSKNIVMWFGRLLSLNRLTCGDSVVYGPAPASFRIRCDPVPSEMTKGARCGDAHFETEGGDDPAGVSDIPYIMGLGDIIKKMVGK